MEWIAVLGIALANNLDNMGAGVAFGIAGIRLPPFINLWIALLTVAITALAVACGRHLTSFLALPVAHALSASILCGMGLWMLLPSLHRQREQPDGAGKGVGEHPDPADRITLLRILADPRCADQNRSRDIDLPEATLLAVALSLNNVGGGFSAGLLHLSVLWTPVFTGLVSLLTLWFGCWAGDHLGVTRIGDRAQAVAGMLLMIIGLCQFR